jgi:hypothetical protein
MALRNIRLVLQSGWLPKRRQGHTTGQPVGLDAFATENQETAPDSLSTAHSMAPSRRWDGRQVAIVGLAAAVLLQLIPTALWLRNVVVRTAVASAPLPSVTEPAVFATAPCTPSALPQPVATTSPVERPKTTAAHAPSMVAGMLSVTAPVPMRVYSGSRLVGTTEADTLMLPVGNHTLDFVNDAVGYRARRTVTVQAGKTTTTRLDPPSGTLHVNAVPWAEVWLDNQRIGETPIGNLASPIGTHEVVFRHPELGERKGTVLVTLKAPARISMDLRKP